LHIFGEGIAARESDPEGLGRNSIWHVWRYDRGGIVKEDDDSFRRVAGTGTRRETEVTEMGDSDHGERCRLRSGRVW
jgi:hypothetical protein